MTNDALFGTARAYDCGYRAGHAAAQFAADARVKALEAAVQGFVTSIAGRNTYERMLTINRAELMAELMALVGGVLKESK